MLNEKDLILPLLGFSDLYLVDDPLMSPWRQNVKIWSQFKDQNGVNLIAACSGVLIDPKHVLTAGHCVYMHTESGYAINDWAKEATVAPAYEYYTFPFGVASAISFHTWSGWVQNKDYNHDIGIIELDRNIGALSGWLDYSYDDSCSFFTSNDFINPGYPAENPYDGLYMYAWDGKFDGCPLLSNWLEINKRGFQGQSGSGFFTDNSFITYGVLSHKVINIWGTYTRACKLTSTKTDDINDDIIKKTPSIVDLMPLNVTISPSSLPAGNKISSMSYIVHNYSSVTWTGTIDASIYLSTNDQISHEFDTLINTHSFPVTIGPKSSKKKILDDL